MAYGFATHLWVLGTPEAKLLTQWLLSVAPDLRHGEVEAWRLGERVLIGAANTSDRETRWRSIGVVNSLSSVVKGFDWVSVDLQPDLGSWRVAKRNEAALSSDDAPPSREQAKDVLRALVPLKLDELHHYVDWAQQLEETVDGAPAPALNLPVERLTLQLPAAARPSASADPTDTSRVFMYWLEFVCLVATAFTVSMTQPPGPAAFGARLNHFVLQAVALWGLGIGLLGATSNGWPLPRRALLALAAFGVGGVLWAALPL